MEILVADGLSTDGTSQILADFQEQHREVSIRLLKNPGKIVAIGLNIATRQARGEIIIRVDGHCVIAADYVRKCVEHIQEHGVAGVGGPMESIGGTQVAKAIAVGMSSPFGVGNSAFRTTTGKNMLTDTVPFPAYTREIIQHAGRDEELSATR
jgi:glycosyltransferase involved in cell wall biosynthesis